MSENGLRQDKSEQYKEERDKERSFCRVRQDKENSWYGVENTARERERDIVKQSLEVHFWESDLPSEKKPFNHVTN